MYPQNNNSYKLYKNNIYIFFWFLGTNILLTIGLFFNFSHKNVTPFSEGKLNL